MSQPLETSVTLADKLQTLVQDFISQLPADAQQTVGQSFERLLTSNTGANAIQEGDKAPDFVLPGVNGNPVQLGKLLEKGPVVLSFYRGGWCPFCSLEFKALINILPQIQSLGAQLIGVSPETQDTSAKTVRDHSIPFEVLSDQGNVVARDYGLLFGVYEEMRPLYLQWGLDIPAANGDDTWELPVPATYVIDSSGRVHTAFVEKDYTKRMEPSDIVKALKSL